jgi:hypothetical protein
MPHKRELRRHLDGLRLVPHGGLQHHHESQSQGYWNSDHLQRLPQYDGMVAGNI